MPLIFISCLLLSFSGLSGAEVLTEDQISERIKSSVPWKQVEAGTAAQKAQSLGAQSQFELYGTAEAGYGESRLDPVFQFEPVFSFTRSASLGLKKKFRRGFSGSLKLYDESLSIRSQVDSAHRTGLRLGLEVDLFSNFLGRMDNSIYQQAKASEEIAKSYNGFHKNRIYLEAYKLFWSYLSANQSKVLAKELLKTAKNQLSEISRKQKVGAADRGDLAQARSFVSNRKNQLSLLTYQENQLMKALKAFFPKITSVQTPEMGPRINEAMGCVGRITQMTQPPGTSLSQIIEFLEKQKQFAMKEANATGDIDLKLRGQYDSNAVGTGFSQSSDRFSTDPKSAYQIGLSLSVPLSGEKRGLEKAKKRIASNQYDAEIVKLKTDIRESHQTAQANILLLVEALKEQASSVKNLNISMNSARRKFSQARISLRDYITEQDKVFGSRLEEIQTRERMIHEILTYSQVFDQFQCGVKKL